MWDFEHAPLATDLAKRYSLHYTQPALCADELLSGRADIGLIPIAALTDDLAIVPGCTIASLREVRSIQLIVKAKLLNESDSRSQGLGKFSTLRGVDTIAADTASRSSLAYVDILFRRFLGTHPVFLPSPADPIAMLQRADAAILIGDPALIALESREAIERTVGPCLWFDIAREWQTRTNLPWVAAVWAVRPEAISRSRFTPEQLIEDLTLSRDHGVAHIEELVAEWTPRLALSASTIRHYLTENIHYHLDAECIRAIELFRQYAAEVDVLPPLLSLRFL